MPDPPKPSPPPPPPPPPAPPPPPNVLQPAATGASEGSNAGKNSKGRKSLRIDLTSPNVSGSSGLNLPVGS